MTRSSRMFLVLLLSSCTQHGDGNVPDAPAAAEAGTPSPGTPASTRHVVEPDSLPAAGQVAPDAQASSHATIVNELRRLLVGTATLDGAAISEVRVQDACRTAFTTAVATVTIGWRRAGNIAPRDVNGRELNDLGSSQISF